MRNLQVKVVERQQNISIQEQEIMRKEKELDSKVKKPAEAEKYRLEKIAEAEKQRIVLEAEAESEAKALKGEAEAYAIEVKAKAEAEQVEQWEDKLLHQMKILSLMFVQCLTITKCRWPRRLTPGKSTRRPRWST